MANIKLLKPTKGKIIITIVLSAIATLDFWASTQILKCVRLNCPAEYPCGNYPNLIDNNCCDTCADFIEFITELFMSILIPFCFSFFILYLLFSVIKAIALKIKKYPGLIFLLFLIFTILYIPLFAKFLSIFFNSRLWPMFISFSSYLVIMHIVFYYQADKKRRGEYINGLKSLIAKRKK